MKLNKEYLLELAEKREKIAIHTKTQEQWNEILDAFYDSKFNCTLSYLKFLQYNEQSCIDLAWERLIKYSPLNYFKEEGYKILSYSDVCIVSEQKTHSFELDKDFLIAQRGKYVVVNCKTQEEYDNIIKTLDSNLNNYWETYAQETCINLKNEKLTWCYVSFYQKKGNTILSYEDCCKKEIKEELKTINIRIGDEMGKLIISKTALELLKNGEKIRVF